MNTTSDEEPDRDPGLARERTRLAWSRTALATTALAVTITKAHPVVGLPELAVCTLIWALGRRHLPGPTPHHSQRRTLLAAGVIVCVCAAALLAALSGSAPKDARQPKHRPSPAAEAQRRRPVRVPLSRPSTGDASAIASTAWVSSRSAGSAVDRTR
jgi:uncharacterized membrane protein YidH (DUF202 family)